MHARRSITCSSATLAILGWGAGISLAARQGLAVGVNPLWIASMFLASTFTVVWAMCVVLPSLVQAYGIGHRDGLRVGRAMDDDADHESKPLRLVR